MGCERVRGAKQEWGSCWQTRDKGGWVFVKTSKEAGTPSKKSRDAMGCKGSNWAGVMCHVNIVTYNL